MQFGTSGGEKGVMRQNYSGILHRDALSLHQRIFMYLSSCISRYIEDRDGICEVFAAPFAVFLSDDNRNYVEPDISVICDSDKLDDRGCKGAPDWVIEIVSPGSKRMDYVTKFFKLLYGIWNRVRNNRILWKCILSEIG